ncbi:hypothetical protein NUM3379_03420 [Kineococcus sp. NUM-3379]
MSGWLLDACSLLSWLDPDGTEEPAAHAVLDGVIAVPRQRVCMSLVTVAEVAGVLSRKFADPATAGGLLPDLQALGIELLPWTQRHAALVPGVLAAERAARREHRGRLSLGDVACLATGVAEGLLVLTSDQFWKTLPLEVELRDYRAAAGEGRRGS